MEFLLNHLGPFFTGWSISTTSWAVLVFLISAAVTMLLRSVFQHRIDKFTSSLSRKAPMERADISGIWISEYVYYSDHHNPGAHVAGHFVEITPSHKRVGIRSLPHPDGSKMIMELEMEGNILNGRWREKTSRGSVYFGSISLVISPNKNTIFGAWCGFDNAYRIQSGPWYFRFLTSDTSKKAKNKLSRLEPEFLLRAEDPPFPVRQYELPPRFPQT